MPRARRGRPPALPRSRPRPGFSRCHPGVLQACGAGPRWVQAVEHWSPGGSGGATSDRPRGAEDHRTAGVHTRFLPRRCLWHAPAHRAARGHSVTPCLLSVCRTDTGGGFPRPRAQQGPQCHQLSGWTETPGTLGPAPGCRVGGGAKAAVSLCHLRCQLLKNMKCWLLLRVRAD